MRTSAPALGSAAASPPGRGLFAGLNATILPGLRLGDDVVIGAGAVVTRDVPTGATMVGVPARRSPSYFPFFPFCAVGQRATV